MQDPSTVEISAITAANTLACQRMELFREDAATATNVCKKPKGKGDPSEAPLVKLLSFCFGGGVAALLHQSLKLKTHCTGLKLQNR